MLTIRRSNLKLLSVAIGLLFTAAIYYSMHYLIPWDWSAPGIGKLPQEIVRGFMAEAYDQGRGAQAVRDYFSPTTFDTAPTAQDRRDGSPIPDHVRRVVAQGANVVVFHRIGPSRGEPAVDAIDVFETRNGRIVRRERFLTSFAGA